MKRYWKFYAEHDDGKGFYLEEENIFVGTDKEAEDEGTRRSDAYTEETGRFISSLTMESQGKVID